MKTTSLLTFALACAAAVPLLGQENYTHWQFSRSIVVNTTATGANTSTTITDFPLLVRLTDTERDVFGNAKYKGADLRFTKADGVTRLQHQIVVWDTVNLAAEVWVLVDTVAASGYTTLRMYWSNDAAADSSSGAKVFKTANGFVGAWHMGASKPDHGRSNAVGGSNAAVPSGNTGVINISSVPGVIGMADSLRGNGTSAGFIGDHFNLGTGLSTLGGNGEVTLSLWVKPESFDETNSVKFMALGNSSSQNLLWIGRSTSSGNRLSGNSVTTTGSGSTLQAGTNTLIPGVWQHVAYTVHNTSNTHTLYLNGVQVAQNTSAQSVSNVTRSLNYIGRSLTTSEKTFHGLVDEVSLANMARSADWLRLAYETQRPQANPVMIGRTSGEGAYAPLSAGALSIIGPVTEEYGDEWASEFEGDHYHGLRMKKTHTELGLSMETTLDPDMLTIRQAHTYEVRLSPSSFQIQQNFLDSLGNPEISRTEISPWEVRTKALYGMTAVLAGLTAENIGAQNIETETLRATEVVTTPKWEIIPDYVFEPGYSLKSLSEIESFVRTNKHLPGIPSARHIADNGMSLTEMNLGLLRSVEELTLHVIELRKDLESEKARKR